MEWCEAKDHAGVMGESNRLLSALIRHSKSKVRRSPDVHYAELEERLTLSLGGGGSCSCFIKPLHLPQLALTFVRHIFLDS